MILGHNCYTGYYPICRIKNGHLIEYHQRDDIFVSDRQFEQRGYFVQGESAHILKTGDGEVDTSTGIGPHYKSETYPVNVRAIRAGSGVKVYQRENYIEIEASGAGGSGEWSGECIGYEGNTESPLPFSKGCCVYNEYTLMPSEFHTIYGNIGPNGLSNITTQFGNPDGQGGNNDTILLNSNFGLCGAEGTAEHWAYKEINNGIATFRGLKAGTGVIFTNDQSDPADDSSYCVTTIHCPSGHTGWSGENVGYGVGVYKEHTLMPAEFHTLRGTDNITVNLNGETIDFGANYDNCTDTADWLAYKTLNAQSEAEFRGLDAGTGIKFTKDVDHATNYCKTTISTDLDNCISFPAAEWQAYKGPNGEQEEFRGLIAGSGIVFEKNVDHATNYCVSTIHSTTGWSGENVGGGAEVYDEYTLMPSKFRTLTGQDSIVCAVNGDNITIGVNIDNCSSTPAADWQSYKGTNAGVDEFRGLRFGDGIKIAVGSNYQDCAPEIQTDLESCTTSSPSWEAFMGYTVAGVAQFNSLNAGCGISMSPDGSDSCMTNISTLLQNCNSAGYTPYKGCNGNYEEFHTLKPDPASPAEVTISAVDGGCGYQISVACCTSSDDYYISDYLIHTSDSDTKMGYPAADTIDFHTAGSARMTIKSDGKIGIGSTSPDYTLTVDGSIGGSSFGISDGKAVLIDGSPSDDQYARFTANGLEGRSASDVRSDLSLGSLATLSAVDADSVTVSNLEVDNLKASTLVTESEGIGSNDNDTTIPTSAAVKDYVDNNDGNVYVSSAAFGTSDGVLTLTRTDSATVTVDLDGRYQDEITSSSRLNANLIGANGDVSNTEFGYLDGVTSAIQTQLDAKQATISASSRLNANLIGSSGNVSNTEFDYLDGVTSAIQTQIDGKQASLTFGISNTNAVKIDSASVADDQFARFTSSGLEGRSASDVRSDLSLGSLATLSAVDADSVTVSNLEVDNLKASTLVTESEGIGSNDNDTTIPTSAAVKDYVDNNVMEMFMYRAQLSEPLTEF